MNVFRFVGTVRCGRMVVCIFLYINVICAIQDEHVCWNKVITEAECEREREPDLNGAETEFPNMFT